MFRLHTEFCCSALLSILWPTTGRQSASWRFQTIPGASNAYTLFLAGGSVPGSQLVLLPRGGNLSVNSSRAAVPTDAMLLPFSQAKWGAECTEPSCCCLSV